MTPHYQKNGPRPSARARLRVTHPHAAGIDVHATVHWVAVPVEDAPAAPPDPPPNLPPLVGFLGACTANLLALAECLTTRRIGPAFMESPGTYGIPLPKRLESRRFQVLLVEPRQSRHAPGRPKSDVLD